MKRVTTWGCSFTHTLHHILRGGGCFAVREWYWLMCRGLALSQLLVLVIASILFPIRSSSVRGEQDSSPAIQDCIPEPLHRHPPKLPAAAWARVQHSESWQQVKSKVIPLRSPEFGSNLLEFSASGVENILRYLGFSGQRQIWFFFSLNLTTFYVPCWDLAFI